LLATIGHPELAADPRFSSNRARLAHVEALDASIAEWVGSLPAAEAVRRLVAARVSAAVVDDLPHVLENPHFRARGAIVDVADDALGVVPMAGPLPTGSPRAAIRHPGRGVAADEDEVFRRWLCLA